MTSKPAIEQLREARAEAEQWRRLFTALVAETVGVTDPDRPAAVVRIPMRHFMVDDLVLVSWPVVEFTYDFSVYRKGSEPVVPSAEVADTVTVIEFDADDVVSDQ